MEIQKTIKNLNPWWQNIQIDLGVERKRYKKQILESLNDKRISFVLGSRRVGKTVLIFQVINELIKEGINPKKILFISLDNSNLKDVDLSSLILDGKYDYVFLDEIQYLKNWETILKSIYDIPGSKLKIVCSGSSSFLLHDKKGMLTGRNKSITVYPLDFKEFQQFSNKKDYKAETINYLEHGGYPEYILNRHPNYHNQLLEDIIRKDIVDRYNIRLIDPILELVSLVARQVGFKTSINKLSKVLKISDDTVKSYLEFLSQSYLIDYIYKYSPSVNDRVYSAKKYYFWDLGMRNSLTGFKDLGSLAENAVYNRLKSQNPTSQIFYHSDSSQSEIDFLLVEKQQANFMK